MCFLYIADEMKCVTLYLLVFFLGDLDYFLVTSQELENMEITVCKC